MKKLLLFILCFGVSFIAAEDSYAGGMIMRIQQMKALKQQRYQELQQEQEGGSSDNQGNAQLNSEQTYQQSVDARNQAIAQAIINAHNPAVSGDNIQGTSDTSVVQAQGQSVTPQPPSPTSSNTVQDVVDLSEVWKKLDNKSTVWALLIDEQAKVLTVSEYIDRYHKEGVKINEPPEHYVQMIDQMSASNPQMLERPFGQLIQILAIIDYDFDNGMDRDELARKVLGEQGYEENKQRFTQQQQPQQH